MNHHIIRHTDASAHVYRGSAAWCGESFRAFERRRPGDSHDFGSVDAAIAFVESIDGATYSLWGPCERLRYAAVREALFDAVESAVGEPDGAYARAWPISGHMYGDEWMSESVRTIDLRCVSRHPKVGNWTFGYSVAATVQQTPVTGTLNCRISIYRDTMGDPWGARRHDSFEARMEVDRGVALSDIGEWACAAVRDNLFAKIEAERALVYARQCERAASRT